MPTRVELGKLGEQLAVAYLKHQRYRILERNYRPKGFVRGGEIDIIAFDGPTLVFVEVKTRRSSTYAEPVESVGYHKQQKLRWLAERYIAEKNLTDREARLDVISIVAAAKPLIEHIKNAF